MEKGKIKEFKIPLSLVFLAISLFASTIIAIYWFSLAILPTDFSSFINYTGNWVYYIFALSIIGDGYFIYLFFSTINARRKFEELMNTDSKSNFVKNIRDLEMEARKLGPSFKKRLDEKKEQLKIKF